MRVAARRVSCPGWSAIAAAHRDASAATAARSSSPPSTRKANGMAASHSCAYMVGLLVLPTQHASAGVCFEVSHRRADPRRHLGGWRLEHDACGEVPALAEVLLERRYRVQSIGRGKRVASVLDRADPVDAVAADRARMVGVAQQIPASVADHDRPRVDLRFPFTA